MAVTTTGSFTLDCKATWLQRTVLNDGTSLVDSNSHDASVTAAYGAATDQCDTLWHDERTIAAGANDDLDLTSLTRAFANGTVASNFARVKLIHIDLYAGASGDKLVLDSSVTNGYLGPFNGSATSQLAIGPGSTDGPTVLSNMRDGFGLTTTSNKVLRVKNPGANPVTYTIAIFGTSA